MKIIGQHIKNIPWEEKPVHSDQVIWRYSKNPIIPRDLLKTSNSIFNSAVVPFKDGFAGVFRCDNKARQMKIHRGFSKDGINWTIDEKSIQFIAHDENTLATSDYQYDPRVVEIDGRFFIQWCNGYHGPTIGLGYTDDFESFYQMENAFLPFNRNGVLFPRKINNHYVMLSRPSDTGHTAFGDIFLSQSKDLIYWGKHRFVLGVAPFEQSAWQTLKIGAGPAPIETTEGWLLFYHGVLRSCNGYHYSMGVALLDLEDPSKVVARSKDYLLAPATSYELMGDVANVIFPCAALADAKTGKIAIYYGAADTVTGMAFTTIEKLIPWLMSNNLLDEQ
ncbi:glycoside hydrolase family 130 protein [Peloplasma aerotolerans]|uniref:Glycoside hydrolase family 130 protein n=1 Tax=Peloplasma aerotolerans TaxID=3044389 RepID=A0AAW6U772_9MOLU|nr:glycoside hydrolase family 130 protein [Mariniplasma sp. M4Ah]MDI6452429.1 glycoside hydrolase family 130 protein [Mariniplasma sp. M4Ah]MDR4968421.1 glycoside hydrolase family 130 protein [Acholeplasmataceae bacterium]